MLYDCLNWRASYHGEQAQACDKSPIKFAGGFSSSHLSLVPPRNSHIEDFTINTTPYGLTAIRLTSSEVLFRGYQVERLRDS